MTMRPLAALCLALALALAAPAAAQDQDGPSRPALLAAVGLLQTETVTVTPEEGPAFTLELPSSEQVRPVRREMEEAGPDLLAAWDFVTGDDRLVESLIVTTGTVESAPRETRLFTMANLLVLRSFPQLASQYQSARLLAFGPVARDDALDAVQMIGQFDPEPGRRIVFRHVGLMEAGREDVLIAIVNVNAGVLNVRNDAELLDTYASRALASLRLLPEQDG